MKKRISLHALSTESPLRGTQLRYGKPIIFQPIWEDLTLQRQRFTSVTTWKRLLLAKRWISRRMFLLKSRLFSQWCSHNGGKWAKLKFKIRWQLFYSFRPISATSFDFGSQVALWCIEPQMQGLWLQNLITKNPPSAVLDAYIPLKSRYCMLRINDTVASNRKAIR